MIRENYHWTDWFFSLFPYDFRFWFKDFKLRKRLKITSWNLLDNKPNYAPKNPKSNGELSYEQISKMLKYSKETLTLCLLSDIKVVRQIAEIIMKEKS